MNFRQWIFIPNSYNEIADPSQVKICIRQSYHAVYCYFTFFFFNFNYNFLPQKFRKLSLQQKIPRVRRIYTDYQRELLIKEYLSRIILVGSEKMIRDPRQLCHNKISNTNSMPKAKKRQIKDNANNYAKLLEAIPDISDLVAVTDAVLFLISESHAKRNLNFLANSGLNI